MKNCTADRTSERGIALIVVLLLMAVLSGLATGFALTGQTETAMSANEVYFAGARAAAEAGLNRALVKIFADTSTNWLAGVDGLVDASNASATVNADNGSLTFLLGTGPFYVDSANHYSFDVQILDDDNDLLYETPLTAAQRTAMGEDGSVYTNANDRVILRATGYGPNGTTIKLARIIESFDTLHTSTTTTTSVSNPALLVNGNLEMNGNIQITGINAATAGSGSVHANGNLSKTGTSGTVSGSATASGTYSTSGGFTPGGASGGGRATINVPDIHASDYESLASYKLAVVGGVGKVQTRVGGVWTNCTTAACTGLGWSYSGGTWNASSAPSDAILYAEGNVDIGTTSGSTVRNVSVFATGDISVHGNAKLGPNTAANGMQFVTDGDLMIDNGSDLDPPSFTDGQIMVRGQADLGGSMEFQGRVLVQDVAGAGSLVTSNVIHGTIHLSYAGTLTAITTITTITTSSPTTYVNNVSGWMEQ